MELAITTIESVAYQIFRFDDGWTFRVAHPEGVMSADFKFLGDLFIYAEVHYGAEVLILLCQSIPI